jgi:hypothetical protein
LSESASVEWSANLSNEAINRNDDNDDDDDDYEDNVFKCR